LVCHANTSYFGKSNWPVLHSAYTSLRAFEAGRSIVLVNDTGYSVGADAVGRIFWYSGDGKRAIYMVQTPVEKIDALPLHYPNLIWIGLFAAVLWGGFIRVYSWVT
jgi:apolipoprotein N-acyltransferase